MKGKQLSTDELAKGLEEGLSTDDRDRWQNITNSRDVDKANFMHCWKGMSNPDNNPFQMEWFGLAMGLGFVLAFGYWATNFAVVQCGMATNSMLAARRTPLIAAVPKMFFPFLIVVPGIIAVVVAAQKPNDQGLIPVKKEMWTKEPSAFAIRGETLVSLQRNKVPDNVVAKLREWMQKEEKGKQFANQEALLTALKGTLTDEEIKEHGQLIVKNSKPERDYDLAMPMMLLQYLPTGILGLGLTALLASFMSGVAGNTAAINNVWTFDIYRAYINPNKSERHYLLMGHAATFVGTALRDRGGVYRLKIQQHHGDVAVRLRLCQCASLCNLLAGHVLEAHDRAWGLLRLAVRHRGSRYPPWFDLAGRRCCRSQGRMAHFRWGRLAHLRERICR